MLKHYLSCTYDYNITHAYPHLWQKNEKLLWNAT